MSNSLRDAYRSIAGDYLSRKKQPWRDFEQFATQLQWTSIDILLDLGAGNGRNLHVLDASLKIAFDLSFELLIGYAGPPEGQKVAGALPQLPFRKGIDAHALLIAVLHHFEDPQLVVQTLQKCRILSSHMVLSVWRRWRRDYRDKLFKAFRSGQPLEPLINHHRPWKSPDQNVLSTRFYHYYTFREIYQQLLISGWRIKKYWYGGGKYNDANIFIEAI